MLSLHDFEHLTIWLQALLFAFPTYLAAKTYIRLEKRIYLSITALMTLLTLVFGAIGHHASDEEVANQASARAALQAKVGQLQQTVSRLSGKGSYPVIESGLTTKHTGRLIMLNNTRSPLVNMRVEYSCSYLGSRISFRENVGTIPPDSAVELAVLLPLERCRAFNPTSASTPPMSAWWIRMTSESGQFDETLLFRRGPHCPMWDWNAQVDRVAGFGYLKSGRLGYVSRNKLLWHTNGWVNQKCSSRYRY